MLSARKIILSVLLACVACGSATALTETEIREKSALDLIQYPWHDLQYEIVFRPPQTGIRAMIFPPQHRIEIYVRPGDDYRLLAYDIAHELGHAIDLTFNTDATRKIWMKERGIEAGTAWFGCSGCSDYATPAGDFAESFATLLLGSGHFAGRLAPTPTLAQIPDLQLFFPKATFPKH